LTDNPLVVEYVYLGGFMKFLDRAMKIAYDRYTPNHQHRCSHFAIAFDGNKPLAIAQNNPIKMNAKAKRMGEKFNVQTYIDFPFLHSETNLICKLYQEYGCINSSWKMVVIRIGRSGKMMISKPCNNCQTILNKVYWIDNVYWSVDDRVFSNTDSQYIYV
jgi:hypothetical protein